MPLPENIEVGLCSTPPIQILGLHKISHTGLAKEFKQWVQGCNTNAGSIFQLIYTFLNIMSLKECGNCSGHLIFYLCGKSQITKCLSAQQISLLQQVKLFGKREHTRKEESMCKFKQSSCNDKLNQILQTNYAQLVTNIQNNCRNLLNYTFTNANSAKVQN